MELISTQRVHRNTISQKQRSKLLYGVQCCKTTKSTETKLEIFQNECLQKSLKVHWPNMFKNSQWHTMVDMKLVRESIEAKRWKWLGRIFFILNWTQLLGSLCNTFHKAKEDAANQRKSGEELYQKILRVEGQKGNKLSKTLSMLEEGMILLSFRVSQGTMITE